jgi:hypothetical protein
MLVKKINKMYNIMNEMKADAGIEAPRITPYRYLKQFSSCFSTCV